MTSSHQHLFVQKKTVSVMLIFTFSASPAPLVKGHSAPEGSVLATGGLWKEEKSELRISLKTYSKALRTFKSDQ